MNIILITWPNFKMENIVSILFNPWMLFSNTWIFFEIVQFWKKNKQKNKKKLKVNFFKK
jgi:hypothetical protein